MTAERILVWGVGTPRTLRVHWTLHELGLAYQTRPIGSRTGETRSDAFLALNPRGKIPVLELGSLTLAESAAIVTALGERFGEGRFVPRGGTPERASYDQWCFWIMTELDAHTLYVMRRHGDLASLYGDAPNAIAAAREYFTWQLATAERELRGGGPHLLGEPFTGADVLLTSCLEWARAYGLEIGDELRRYRDETTRRAAYRDAYRVNFPDAKPG